MAYEGANSREDGSGPEPVYGPGDTAPGYATASVRDRHNVVDGPSPPYTAPYPPYPSDVPEPTPVSLNTAAALAYFVVPAVFFLLLPPYRSQPQLRFHSWQAIFYFLLGVAAREIEQVLASMLPSPVAFLLGSLLLLLLFAGWLVAVVKAVQGERCHLPLVGSFAEQVAQTSSLTR